MNKYLFKVWLTSGILTPIILVLLLSVWPGYHIPDMIGLLLFMYVFPCTLLLSVTNIVVLAVVLSSLRDVKNNIGSKFILSAATVLTAFISMVLVYKSHLFESFDTGVDYMLTSTYCIAVIAALFIYKLNGLATGNS